MSVTEALHFSQWVKKTFVSQQVLSEQTRLAAVGTGAAVLAHEIGNPLNNMFLQAQLLRRLLRKKNENGDKLMEYLNNVTSEIRRLAELLKEFRCFSRDQRLTRKPASISDLIINVLSANKPLFECSRIDVAADLPRNLPSVAMDSGKITQVLVNLFKNAIESMSTGGTISVSAEACDHSVTVVVSDTGDGVPANVDVFEPFQTTKSQGTGLGLPIAKQIVTAHGGTISCENNCDQGARFTIVLPLAVK